MKEAAYSFEDFFAEVGENNREFVAKTHQTLVDDGYKFKVEFKASGFFVSYSFPKTKRSMINFLFRKQGLLVRIYADHFDRYADFLNLMPEKMEQEISKAHVCKRLINPDDCNPKCITGYDFHVKENRYRKCRYSCFQFAVDPENLPFLSEFIEKERKERNQA
jgi:hypothetical protein